MPTDAIYKAYFEAMPCYLTVQDRSLRLIDANAKFRREFGEIDGRLCYQVYKHRSERCEECPVELTFEDGASHSSEELVKTREGKEVWVIVYTTPILDERGNVQWVMEMSTDITREKLLQEKLRESEEKYRLLFEEAPCYISIQDEDLRIVEANRFHREAFGTSFGNKCYEVYKHRAAECEPCIVRQTFKDGEIHTSEEVVTSQQQEQMNVMVYTAPVRDAAGRIEKVIEMSADITVVRELQDKLTSVGLLISSIAHGIKGLLNSLDGGVYLVNSGIKRNEQDRINQGWEMVTRNIDRIRSMVVDLLYYAKDREPQWERVSIAEFIREISSVLADRANKLDIEFHCVRDPDVHYFEADRQAVRALVINLLENALDACRIDKKKAGHRIVLEIKSSPDSILLEVSDNGVGMDRETRERALSLFFSSKGAGGTGLGLFVANKIAQSHGGGIEIESEEGKGSRFVVTIPKKRPEDASEAEHDSKP